MSKSAVVRTLRSSFLGSFAVAFVSFNIGCSPKDLKVSARGGTARGPEVATDASFSDRSPEYTRSLLIELAAAARELETTFQQLQKTAPSETADASALEAAAVKIPTCEVATKIPSTSRSESADKNPVLKFETEFVGCAEDGVTFQGTLNGKKESFATLLPLAGDSDSRFPGHVRVTSLGLENILKPQWNVKDTLRVTTHGTFSADLVAVEEKKLIYRFKKETRSHYTLDLKAFTDSGKIVSSISGLLTYDLETKKVTGFTATEKSDPMILKVESAREGKSGGRIVRQEFFGSAEAETLTVDLSSCSLPMGVINSRFTVGPLGGGDKKYTIDSRATFESGSDHMYKLEQSGTAGADGAALSRGPRTEAKLCAGESLTTTEFYSRLLY